MAMKIMIIAAAIIITAAAQLDAIPHCIATDANNLCIQCQGGYFQSTDNSTCLPCSPNNCASCTNDNTNHSTCLSCTDAHMTLVNKACQCLSGYVISNDQSYCIPCSSNCMVCSNNNNLANCTICNTGTNLDPTKNCASCVLGYYMTLQGCIKCPASCSSCVNDGSGNVVCAICTDPTMIASSQCSCPVGSFLKNNNITCASCNTIASCYSCTNNGADSPKCLSCMGNLSPIAATNTCGCLPGFYLNTSNLCWKCPASCSACSLGASLTCSSCVDPNMDTTTPLCACKVGYFLSTNLTNCIPCSSSYPACTACTNNGNNSAICTSCQGANMITWNGGCSCSNGYYLSNNACVACPNQCSLCANSNGNVICYSCNVAANPYLVLAPNQQSCICRQGYYMVTGAGSSSCAACPPTCSSCTSSSNCLTCTSSGMSLPLCTCAAGQMPYIDYMSCVNCAPGCSACSYNGRLSGNCTQCINDPNIVYVTNSTGGSCSCSGSYFINQTGGNSQCSPCPLGCLTCTNLLPQGYCTSCISDPYITLTNGSCSCIVGYYQNVVGQCSECPPTCFSCIDRNNCNYNCYNDPNINSSSITCDCISNTYVFDNQPHCAFCPFECSSCKYTSNNVSCISCKAPQMSVDTNCNCTKSFYLAKSLEQCLPCPPGCSLCYNSPSINDDAPICTACFDTFRINNSLCTCLDATMFVAPVMETCVYCQSYNFLCTSCSVTISYTNGGSLLPLCQTCNTLTDTQNSSCQCPLCTKCIDVNAAINNGICICNAGYVLNATSKICSKCPSNCQTCTSSTQCTSCIESTTMVLSAGGCTCKAGYYLNTAISYKPYCAPCPTGCSTCTSATSCCLDTSCCADSNNRLTGTTTCQCAANYIMYANDGKCYTCSPACSSSQFCAMTSYGQSAPTTPTMACIAQQPFLHALYIVSSSSFTCDYGYVLNSNSNGCAVCPMGCYSNCIYSSGSAICNSNLPQPCSDVNAQYPCSSLCNVGYFPANNGIVCLPCNSTGNQFCSVCVNSNVNVAKCSSCSLSSAPATYDLTTCLCSDKYYMNTSANSCMPCPVGCLTCNSATNCTSCTDQAMYLSVNNLCICADGYYLNGTNCLPCGNGCDMCSSATSCSACTDPNTMVIISNSNTCGCKNSSYSFSFDKKLCLSCPLSCTSCGFDNFNEPTCDGCQDPNMDVSNICNCIAGYFLPINQLKCLLCSTQLNFCSMCAFQGTNLICTACGNNTILVNPTTCGCQTGYGYSTVSSACKNCPVSACASCTFNTNDVATCQTCVDSKMIPANLCACGSGYYMSSSAPVCIKCSLACANCALNQATLQCLSCIDPTSQSLVNNACSCTNSNYYMLNDGSKCTSCGNLCTSCVADVNNNPICSSCFSNAVVINGACVCATGYYYNTTNSACVACPVTCSACSSSTVCTLCISNPYISLVNNMCSCLSGYYFSSPTCLVCPSGCSSCTSYQSCQTCKDTNMVLSSVCACKSGFTTSNDGSKCIACPATCPTTCSNSGLDTSVCTSCPDINANLMNGACICKSGYYYQLNQFTCTSCPLPCKTCTVATMSQLICLTCSDVNMFVSGTSCQCISGYYISNNVCTPCYPLCSLCNSATNCSACVNNQIMAYNNYMCTCATGYYLNSFNTNCLKCPTQCKTCALSAGAVVCSSCQDAVNMNVSTNCLCNTNYFLALNETQCLACPVGCTCMNNGNNVGICGSCTDPINMIITNGLCVCKNGFYLGLTGCFQCPITCMNCSTALYCIVCKSASMNPSNACSCPAATYASVDGTQCLNCPVSCPNCQNKLDVANTPVCLSCYDSNAVVVQGVCKCNIGYFLSTDSKTCKPCGTGCYSCVGGANDISTCTQCQDQVYMTINGPNCACKSSTYMSISTKVCLMCPAICPNCSNSGNDVANCLTCVSNVMVLALGQCSCPTGQFLNTPITCSVCPVSCATCINDGKNNALCTLCTDQVNMNLVGNCVCLSNYYLTTNLKACVLCPIGCKTCTNSGSNTAICVTCTSTYMTVANSLCMCQKAYYLSNNSVDCKACDANCPTCINSGTLDGSKCLTCTDTNMIATTGKCLCIGGFYMSSNTTSCIACSTLCNTCNNINGSPNCLQCVANAFPTLGICHCNSGYYVDKLQVTCLTCPKGCLTCHPDSNGNPVCDSCYDSKNMIVTNLCSCPTNMYLNIASTQCLACPITCQKCNNNGADIPICTLCNDPKTMVIVSNVCGCSAGWFLKNDSSSCIACPNTCAICNNDGNNNPICTLCTDIFNMVTINSICACKQNLYLTSLHLCLNCPGQCPNCKANPDNSPFCLICINSTMVYSSTNGTCTCPTGQYMSNTYNSCLLCRAECAICINDNQNGAICLTCKDPNTYPNGAMCSCKPNTFALINPKLYPNGTSMYCSPCPSTCTVCMNSGNDTAYCTSCQDPHMIIKSGTCQCGNIFYIEQDGTTCGECDNTCQTCKASVNNTSWCTSCYSGNWNSQPDTTGACTCTEGYYLAASRSKCLQCPGNCMNCSNNGLDSYICASCSDSRMVNSTCQCPQPYYMSNSQSTCLTCSSTCNSCKNSGNDTPFCVKCNDASMALNNGVCSCSQGYYYNPTNFVCSRCYGTCAVCTDATNVCSVCANIANVISQNGRCICKGNLVFSNGQCQSAIPTKAWIYIIAGILILAAAITVVLLIFVCH